MPMITTVTLAYEGPPACIDCQREGIPLCSHIGFADAAWIGMPGTNVLVPGLDAAYTHTVRSVEISTDRKTVTLTLDTDRPPILELARHLSTLVDQRAKATVRAVHHETGETLAEGRYDAFLQPDQMVCVNGEPHIVHAVEHPNRGPGGMCPDGQPDLQVVTLAPIPFDTVLPADPAGIPDDVAEALAQVRGTPPRQATSGQ